MNLIEKKAILKNKHLFKLQIKKLKNFKKTKSDFSKDIIKF